MFDVFMFIVLLMLCVVLFLSMLCNMLSLCFDNVGYVWCSCVSMCCGMLICVVLVSV